MQPELKLIIVFIAVLILSVPLMFGGSPKPLDAADARKAGIIVDTSAM